MAATTPEVMAGFSKFIPPGGTDPLGDLPQSDDAKFRFEGGRVVLEYHYVGRGVPTYPRPHFHGKWSCLPNGQGVRQETAYSVHEWGECPYCNASFERRKGSVGYFGCGAVE